MVIKFIAIKDLWFEMNAPSESKLISVTTVSILLTKGIPLNYYCD